MDRFEIIALAAAAGGAVTKGLEAIYSYFTVKTQGEQDAQEAMYQRLWSRIDNLERQIEDLRGKVDEYQELYHETKEELTLTREQNERLVKLNDKLEEENEELQHKLMKGAD